jgi:cell division protein FtsB
MSNINRNIFDSFLTLMVTILVILALLGIVGIAVMILTWVANS